MSIEGVLREGFRTGVGSVTAKAYGACADQSIFFSTVNTLVSIILKRLICSYLQNTRQLFLAQIAIQAASGLAGVLMTRLVCKKCEKAIHWQQALASSVISDIAVFHADSLFFVEPIPLLSGVAKQLNPV
jgi:hypothetical protein